MITVLTHREGAFTLDDFVELHAPALRGKLRVLWYESLAHRPELTSGAFIFAALDQLTAGGLRLVQDLCLRLEQQGCRVLNRPGDALQRAELLSRLAELGHNTHAAVSAAGDLATLRFPVFVREASAHNGPLTPLLPGRNALERALGTLLLRGYPLDELLVVEYCDTRGTDGRYRKYAAFRIGDRIVADGLTRADQWLVYSGTREISEAAILEERDYILGNPHEARIAELFRLARIDYGRIDYAVRDGNLETWEINLHPTIRRGRAPDTRPTPDALDQLKNPARRHFLSRFESALRELDAGVAERPLTIEWDEALLREAGPIVARFGPVGWRASASRALRFLRPVMEPVTRVVSPLVFRRAAAHARLIPP